jgi:hypothetical protein
MTNNLVLAARFLFASEVCPSDFQRPPSKEGRRSAERRIQPMAAPHIRALPSGRARGAAAGIAAPARLPALHRGTRQVFQAWLSSGPALHGIGMYDHPSPRAASSSRAGRSASRAGSRSRPGAVCETARGLPRSLRSQDRIRTAPFGERAASPSTDREGGVKHCHRGSDNRLIQWRFPPPPLAGSLT